MSTIITADNGIEITVGLLAIEVTDPEYTPGIYARLTDAQRVELAAALDPGRRGLHVRLDNQAKTLATFQRERDEALRKKGEAFDRAVRAERERDAAVARAEDAARERDGWRAAAEHRGGLLNQSVPAVTRSDIEKVVEAVFDREAGYDYGSDKPWPGTEPVSSAVWDYLKDADPIVYVVRESDIAAVDVEKRENGGWYTGWGGLTAGSEHDAEHCRNQARQFLKRVAENEAVARAIEAEQAVDPVEEKARELYRAATPDARWETVADEYRRIARHVLGQEASSDE